MSRSSSPNAASIAPERSNRSGFKLFFRSFMEQIQVVIHCGAFTVVHLL